MRSYSGGVRHDYKDSSNIRRALDLSAVNRRGLSWFALGLMLPLVAVVLLLVSEPNESMVPTAADIAPMVCQLMTCHAAIQKLVFWSMARTAELPLN